MVRVIAYSFIFRIHILYINKIKLNCNCAVEELVIVNVYDSPEHSSFKKRQRDLGIESMSTTDHLLEFSMKELEMCENILLVGDFNARTASANHLKQNRYNLVSTFE